MKRKPAWLKYSIAFAIAILVAGIVIFRLPSSRHGTRRPRAHAALPVTVATALRRDVPVYLDSVGTVQPYRSVTVQPMISGPMTSVDFHQGQDVTKGALLATIDPRPYQAALDQALAKRAQDRAALLGARKDLKRYQMLVRQHYASAQQTENQAVAVAEDVALVRQDDAAVETARNNLGYTRITAPISGRTGILQVNAGNIVTPNLAGGIVLISTLRPIFVVFSLPQQDLPEVQKALSTGAPVLALENGATTEHVIDRGVLRVLDNQISPSTGTLTLKALFPNATRALWPGAFVNVALRARIDRAVITVPAVAVHQGPEGSFVYIVRKNSPAVPGPKRGAASGATNVRVAVAQRVVIGYQQENLVEITSGLSPGEDVITEGGSRLRNGVNVRVIRTSAVTPAAAPGRAH
ncbi:MAG: efflux RND transporter periplasmic adaptor subunit [Acidiferrobacteraceae bacterium]